MMHYPAHPMAEFQVPRKDKYGVFLEKLPAFITDEILYSQCKKLNLEGYTFVKVPREYNTKVSQGYAFIYFDSFENACNARKQFNSQGIYKDKVRAALLVDKPKESSDNNFILTDIPLDIEIGQLDEELSKYGTVVSSRIDLKNDKKTSKGIGYVRFYKQQEAEAFRQAAEKNEVKVKDQVIKAMVFKQNQQQISEKKNLFFKDFKKTYTKEQLENDEFITNERQKILDILKNKLEEFGEISSSIVTFNENLLKPFAFVCFKNTEDAQKALEEVNKDEEFPFQFRNWALSKAQMLKQRQSSKKFIYIKHLKPTVTQEKLYKILSEILDKKIVSVQVRTPALAAIKTKYATVMTEEENKKDFLYNSLNPDRKDFFNKDFSECFEKKAYVNYLYPLQQHKNWMKKNLGRRYFGQKMNPQAPPIQFNQQMMMMQYMQQMQMRMMQQQQMPHMQMAPPGMQPNPPMGYPQAPVNYPPPGLAPQQNQQGGHQGFRQPMRQGGYNKPQRPYQQRNQQPRREQQDRNQNQNRQENNNTINNNNNNQQQQQRGRVQPKQVYQPKAVQPKPVSQQQQQKAQNQITIQSIKEKWDDFLKLGKERQQHMFGVLFYPKVQKYAKTQAQVSKITGILTDLSSLDAEDIRDMYEDEEEFIERVREAEELLNNAE